MILQQPEFSILFILFCVYALAFMDQLYYYWFVFGKLAFYKSEKKTRYQGAVSVVICAKNEFFNLSKYLPVVLEQDYPEYEVVVVNDASDDDTDDLLRGLENEYSHLKVVKIKQDLNFFKGKKFPLALGIKSAKHEILLLTDADCKPTSNQWIRKMVSGFDENTDIVIGYGPYRRSKGILNLLIRYDAFMAAMQYLAHSLNGNTYMGVGRNLAYRKSLFYKAKGFISHYKIASGDDDLFINEVATKTNASIEVSHESYTLSKAKTSFGDWFRQKRRHLTTAKYYKSKFIFLLAKYSFSQLLFISLLILLVVLNYNLLIVLSLFGLRLFSQLLVLKKCSRILNERNLLLTSPLLEIVLILMQLGLGFSNLIIKQNKWN